jgi:hypothetical protein
MSAKSDCDALFKEVMPAARPLVDRFGEFYPFSMTMDPQGGVAGLSASPSSDTPSVGEVWDSLGRSLRDLAAAGKLRAAAICVNTKITMAGTEQDAITVFVEHKDGLALEIVVPYQRRGEGHVTYGAPMARPSGPRGPGIFVRVTH